MISIIPATYQTLLADWPIVEPYLDRVCKYNHYRQLPIDILAALGRPTGDWHAWLVLEDDKNILAVLVTTIRQFERRRGLCIYALGGDRWEEWGELIPPVMDCFAEATGCDHQELIGRPGWAKVFGIKPSMVMLFKDMNKNKNGGSDV
jgi:hypothetical protein